MGNTNQSKWMPIQFYCENCKSLIVTYLDSSCCAKVQCEHCGARYRKRIVSDNHSVTESYAPYGEKLLCLSDRH